MPLNVTVIDECLLTNDEEEILFTENGLMKVNGLTLINDGLISLDLKRLMIDEKATIIRMILTIKERYVMPLVNG